MTEPHDDSVDIGAALAGRYKVIKPLGTGATATVYLADDLRHDRRVAIKVVSPPDFITPTSRRSMTQARPGGVCISSCRRSRISLCAND